jgi:hypothetical protein
LSTGYDRIAAAQRPGLFVDQKTLVGAKPTAPSERSQRRLWNFLRSRAFVEQPSLTHLAAEPVVCRIDADMQDQRVRIGVRPDAIQRFQTVSRAS